jgi:hypothetical protein
VETEHIEVISIMKDKYYGGRHVDRNSGFYGWWLESDHPYECQRFVARMGMSGQPGGGSDAYLSARALVELLWKLKVLR